MSQLIIITSRGPVAKRCYCRREELHVWLLLSAPLRSNGADYVFLQFIFFIYFFNFFIHRSFSETTRPILTKFSGIVYSGVV